MFHRHYISVTLTILVACQEMEMFKYKLNVDVKKEFKLIERLRSNKGENPPCF